MSVPLTKEKRDRMIESAESFLLQIKTMPAYDDCRQCDNFHDGFCQHYESTPPESFYLSDCVEWCLMVPF